MDNPDSLQAICAELERIELESCSSVEILAARQRLARLDAEMRKERDLWHTRCIAAMSLIPGDLPRNDLLFAVEDVKELRARLAACERLPEQWHDRAKTIHDSLEQSAVIECADELDAALTLTAQPDVPGGT